MTATRDRERLGADAMKTQRMEPDQASTERNARIPSTTEKSERED